MKLSDPSTRQRIAQALARDARSLVEDQKVPIDLGAVARSLGLELELRPAPARGQGALRYDRGRTIISVHERDLNSSRARFTAAHEVAHHLLDLYGAPRPATRREYWQTEELCNAFAGQLLVPEPAVEWVRDRHAADAETMLHAIRFVAERAMVSRTVVSRRIAGAVEGVSTCEIGYPAPRPPGVIGVIEWIVERFRWLGLSPRTHIHEDHALAALLSEQWRRPVGGVLTMACDGFAVSSERRGRGVWMVCLMPHSRGGAAPESAGDGVEGPSSDSPPLALTDGSA